MRLTFHGAARQVTGSCFGFEVGAHRFLQRCGQAGIPGLAANEALGRVGNAEHAAIFAVLRGRDRENPGQLSAWRQVLAAQGADATLRPVGPCKAWV